MFLQALMYLVPTAGVVAVVYIILKQYFENQQKQQDREYREKKARHFWPAQMQAYERIILLLERMHPERLVFRINKPGMSSRLLQAEMLKTIRDEFDHNLAQQIYISKEAWEAVKAAREETVNILKAAESRVAKEGDSLELASVILELSDQLGKLPTDVAIDILKAEFRKKMK